MDLTLYRLITQQLPDQPDLNRVVQEGGLFAEAWPVILEKIVTYRKQVQYFVVSDGNISLKCVSTVPDLYFRAAQTEIGTLIHLLGARTLYNQTDRCYYVDIEDFMTLRQYDEHLRHVREAEARRLAELADYDTDYKEGPTRQDFVYAGKPYTREYQH